MAAGLEGMRDGLLLENLHTTDEKLPESLAEAAKVALASDFVAGVLPERLVSAYAARAGIRR